MLKFFTHSFGLRQLEKIPTNAEQKFGSIINTFSKQIAKKCYCQGSATLKADMKGYIPFLEKVEQRKEEARRSIVVQVQSEQSYKELYTYCSSVGTVNKMFHYTTGIEPMHYIIVEFAKESDLKHILDTSTYNDEDIGLPTQSHFLWFKAANRKLSKLKENKNARLDLKDSTLVLSETELKKCLLECRDISDQISTLYNSTKLSDVGTRLRFLTGIQIESCLSGMFVNSNVYPFGSSVNGFGKMNCDLDLVLNLSPKKNSDESRLVFHSKSASVFERSMTQKYMETLGDIIHLFLPGCVQVRRILQARVPIIKFHQLFTDIECDLSMSNMSGVYMSDFLYMMGEIDERVRPLVFAVRRWAKEVGVTNSSPGRWISNFSLTLLVLAFLQKPPKSAPILPSLNTLVKLSGPRDKYITGDGINCTFLRDLNKYQHASINTESLSSLLKEFFVYYSQYDFSKNAICLNEAISITKPDFSPMYIVNPLEKGLNVCKNVSLEEVDRFKNETIHAIWKLETEENNENWGLLCLLQNNNKKYNEMALASIAKQERLMDVTTLFADGDQKEDTKFKNSEVKTQVNEIRKFTKNRIKKIETIMKIKR